MKNTHFELPSEAIAALEKGNKIEAIKIVRLEKNLDLKDSKELVETYLSSNPMLEQRFSAIQSQSGRKFLMWLAVIGFAVLAYLVYAGKI